jgi:hypothetical protein
LCPVETYELPCSSRLPLNLFSAARAVRGRAHTLTQKGEDVLKVSKIKNSKASKPGSLPTTPPELAVTSTTDDAVTSSQNLPNKVLSINAMPSPDSMATELMMETSDDVMEGAFSPIQADEEIESEQEEEEEFGSKQEHHHLWHCDKPPDEGSSNIRSPSPEMTPPNELLSARISSRDQISNNDVPMSINTSKCESQFSSARSSHSESPKIKPNKDKNKDRDQIFVALELKEIQSRKREDEDEDKRYGSEGKPSRSIEREHRNTHSKQKINSIHEEEEQELEKLLAAKKKLESLLNDQEEGEIEDEDEDDNDAEFDHDTVKIKRR